MSRAELRAEVRALAEEAAWREGQWNEAVEALLRYRQEIATTVPDWSRLSLLQYRVDFEEGEYLGCLRALEEARTALSEEVEKAWDAVPHLGATEISDATV